LGPREAKKFELGKDRSEALEEIINSQIESSNWFGENAMSQQLSRYDDIFNGCDVVVEFDQGE